MKPYRSSSFGPFGSARNNCMILAQKSSGNHGNCCARGRSPSNHAALSMMTRCVSLNWHGTRCVSLIWQSRHSCNACRKWARAPHAWCASRACACASHSHSCGPSWCALRACACAHVRAHCPHPVRPPFRHPPLHPLPRHPDLRLLPHRSCHPPSECLRSPQPFLPVLELRQKGLLSCAAQQQRPATRQRHQPSQEGNSRHQHSLSKWQMRRQSSTTSLRPPSEP